MTMPTKRVTPSLPVGRATLRHLPMSARKVRLVADLVRGQRVGPALALLEHTPRAGAKPLFKVIKSARDGAEQNPANEGQIADPDTLVISHLSVDGATILWRWRAAAYGRAARIRKRSCHINVELSQA
jgi:large subunit ribosomal protein L22